MIELGKKQTLLIVKSVEFGVYLAEDMNADTKHQVLLPAKQVPAGTKAGDKLEVFIYKDSQDRLIATTNEPLLMVGQAGLLKVKRILKDKNNYAFSCRIRIICNHDTGLPSAAAGMASMDTAMLTASKSARKRFFIGIPLSSGSVVAQRLDGIETCRAPGRQIAEQHTDAHRDAKSHYDGVERRTHRDGGIAHEHGQHLVGRHAHRIAQCNA